MRTESRRLHLLRSSIFPASLLALLALPLAGCAPDATESVDVGIAVPYTGSGVMLDARRAWQLAVEQINAGGGIRGKPLSIHEREPVLDDANDLGPVADGFVDLTREGYKYIISLVSGVAVQPMLDAAVPNGVLAMSVTSEDPASELGAFDGMLLRGILPTDRLVEKQALALQAKGLRSIAIVEETIGGQPDPHQVAMRSAYAGCPGCDAAVVSYAREADLYRYDWESVGAAVMASAPDVIYLTSSNVSAILDTIFWVERAGYTGRYYFAHGGLMASLFAAMPPGSKVPGRFGAYDLALPPSERLDRFLATYRDRYGDSFVPEPRLIAFADYLALLALAMTRVGDADPRAVAAAMKDIAGPPGEAYGTLEFAAAAAAVRAGRDIDFVGLSGPLDFDAEGEVSDGFVQEYAVTPNGDVAAIP